MALSPFKLERFFARYEFSVPHLLCASDVEPIEMATLLGLADEEMGRAWRDLKLGYSDARGLPVLRAEIAALYPGLAPDDILVAAPAEAIFLFMHAVLAPGDHVVAVWPAYQSLYEVARSIGAEVSLLALEPERGWRLDLEALERAVRPDTRLIVINFPHNPTGAILSGEELEAVVAIARRVGAYVFSDEVYRYLERDAADRAPAVVERYERGVSLGALSKSYGLAGLRIGWLAARDAAVLDRVAAIKDYTTICAAAPSEVLGVIALRARESLWSRSREIIRANQTILDTFLAASRGVVDCVPPRGGSTAFPRLDASFPVDRLAEELVQAEGTLVLPASALDYDGNFFRLGLGRKGFGAGLARLERFLAQRLGPGT